MSLVTILLFITIIWDYTKCQYSTLESELSRQLFYNYTKTARPTYVVNVTLGLYYFQLISIDEKNGIMTSVSVLTQSWVDPR